MYICQSKTVPIWATAIAAIAVVGFVAYAFYTLSEQLVTTPWPQTPCPYTVERSPY